MTKQELRKEFLTARMSLSTYETTIQSEAIATQFMNLLPKILSNINNTVLHTFLPITHKNEVNTFLIINQLQQDFKDIKIIVPQVVADSLMLSHLYITPQIQFSYDKWGIPVPDSAIEYQSPKSEITAILMPLLAYDHMGYRVGYGKGFYDRFLAECSVDVIKIGLSFFEPVEAISDINSHDVPLNYCLTPRQIWKF